ncbi:MAG: thiamine phosphate synthase [Streptosporangiaceae bacterium]
MPADVRDRLSDALLYLCTDARQRQGDLVSFLDAVLGNGVDIVQLRQKGLEAGAELRFLEVFRAACAAHGALLAVNDRADVAFAAGADILHLGQDDLPAATARRILGPESLIGLSTHAAAEADLASADPAADYFCAGPVWPTPTKPGRLAPGLPLVAHATALDTARPGSARPGSARPGTARPVRARPWFAIGGIDEHNLDEVLAAGARRVVVVRAITEAADPGAAAARLAARLREAAPAG